MRAIDESLTPMSKQQLPPENIERVFQILSREMPGRAPGAMGPKGQPNPFRTCISCMLSAQSRDANTASATAALFKLARSPRTMLQLSESQISEAIKPCGLYNVKTKNVRKFCRALLDEFGGVVPSTRAQLMQLPGIGRKCADIVMQFAFGIDTIAVDTHVHRVCNRTGIAIGTNAEKTAEALDEMAPPWAFAEGHFWLIQFGKRICLSRTPKCETCPINEFCLKRADDRRSESE
ncbi:endonuclease III domain-containing protein [Rhodopirellula sp. P2]|uniref:endonuclease III domain-containing protein n=1 Tax=Rhodopirellula sp. P2 TaxID=2127060 RepID=UPI002368F15A|nr:endonuclease III [Rhodopirellula sp. P2]WDQ15355.1 endonuclease III [Rhodopirellula sp. P2]